MRRLKYCLISFLSMARNSRELNPLDPVSWLVQLGFRTIIFHRKGKLVSLVFQPCLEWNGLVEPIGYIKRLSLAQNRSLLLLKIIINWLGKQTIIFWVLGAHKERCFGCIRSVLEVVEIELYRGKLEVQLAPDFIRELLRAQSFWTQSDYQLSPTTRLRPQSSVLPTLVRLCS